MVIRKVVEKKIEVVTGYRCESCGAECSGNGGELPNGWATIDIEREYGSDVYDHVCSIHCFIKEMKIYLKETPFNPKNEFNGLSTNFAHDIISALLDCTSGDEKE